MAMDWIIGGVEVQDNPVRRHGVGLEEQRTEEIFDSSDVAGDLLIPAILIGPDRGQFQAVEGTLARQGLSFVTLVDS